MSTTVQTVRGPIETAPWGAPSGSEHCRGHRLLPTHPHPGSHTAPGPQSYRPAANRPRERRSLSRGSCRLRPVNDSICFIR